MVIEIDSPPFGIQRIRFVGHRHRNTVSSHRGAAKMQPVRRLLHHFSRGQTLAVQIPAAFDLVRRRRAAPQKILGKCCWYIGFIHRIVLS